MPLRIVAYTDKQTAFLADCLARCINHRTNHMCRCVRADEAGGHVLYEGYDHWMRAPRAAHEELASADLIFQCAGRIAPQHRVATGVKPTLRVTGQGKARSAALRVQRAAGGDAERSACRVAPFPVPWWDVDFSLGSKGEIPTIYASPGNDASTAVPSALASIQSYYADAVQVLDANPAEAQSGDRGRAAHVLVDDLSPGCGGQLSLMALSWGCVVVNGLAASSSTRTAFRDLTRSGGDPPFLCAGPTTIEHLLSCLVESGASTLADQGDQNRRWLETEWDFSEQWKAFWLPAINDVLDAASVGARQPLIDGGSPARSRSSVSVVIVSRDEGVYLRRTLHSLHATLSPRDEIVVIDDQSNDSSTEGLSDSYEGVRILRPPSRLGVAGARNYGARHAHGDILVFSDAHIEVPRDWVAPIAEALGPRDAGSAGAALQSLEQRMGKGVCGGRWYPGDHDYLRWQWLGCRDSEPYGVPLLSGGFLAVRHDVFDAVGGFDSGMWMYGVEDAELSVRLWTLGYQCLAVPRVLVAHRFSRPTRNKWCDYKVGLGMHIHNKLRLAILHFRPERIKRVTESFATCRYFSDAFARLATGDAWMRRREIQASRKYDDDWYFRRFSNGL